MIDLSCQDSLHTHLWHDQTFNRDFMIPETFIAEIVRDLVEPLQKAQEAIQRAIAILGEENAVTELLVAALGTEDEEPADA